MNWELLFTKQAQKDAKKIASSGLRSKVQDLLDILCKNSLQQPPPYRKLIGDLIGTYSRRINIQHRIVYQVIEEKKIVKIIRMWTHYK